MQPTETKTIEIIVNAKKKDVEKNSSLSYSSLVQLAFDNPPTGANVRFTVTYRKGKGQKEESLIEGQSVKAKEGMVFNVTPTDKS